MKITCVSISDIEEVRNGKNRSKEITVTFIGDDGEEHERTLRDWCDKQAFEDAQTMQEDVDYEVTVKKNGKYWNWMSIDEVGAGKKQSGSKTSSSSTKGSSGGSDWAAKNALDRERFEFDKLKQDLIIRQSCVSSAVALVHDKGASEEDVLFVASIFEDYVWHGFQVVKPDTVKKPRAKKVNKEDDDDLPS